METIIKIDHLEKSFGNLQVLRDVCLDIHKGEVVTIIGSSGSGKSTLLRCINLLERPNAGSIHFHEDDILESKMNINQYRSKVGMVFQKFNLFPHKKSANFFELTDLLLIYYLIDNNYMPNNLFLLLFYNIYHSDN